MKHINRALESELARRFFLARRLFYMVFIFSFSDRRPANFSASYDVHLLGN
jgi:hypothetical protein